MTNNYKLQECDIRTKMNRYAEREWIHAWETDNWERYYERIEKTIEYWNSIIHEHNLKCSNPRDHWSYIKYRELTITR